MAARTSRIRHDENTRNKIKAAQLINRLHDCVNGDAEMSATQVSAAKALLNKVLPDLQQVEADVESRQSVVTADPMSPEQWSQQYAGDDAD